MGIFERHAMLAANEHLVKETYGMYRHVGKTKMARRIKRATITVVC